MDITKGNPRRQPEMSKDQPLKPGEYRILPGDWTDPVMAAQKGRPADDITASERNRNRHRELERWRPW